MDIIKSTSFKSFSNQTKSHSNNVNTMGFRVSFFCLIVVNSYQHFCMLAAEITPSMLQGMHG